MNKPVLYQEDLPPEYCKYQDEGCDLAPSCLECPFPTCVYDLPRGKQRHHNQLRSERMVALRSQGRSIREIARTLGVSRRTVQRSLNQQ